MIDLVVNLSDRTAKTDLLHRLGAMGGLQRIRISDARRSRTNPQNRYYFGIVIKALQNYLSEQGQVLSSDDCHELFKTKFLMREVNDKNTGDVIGFYMGSTTKLSIEEFSKYVDQCVLWLQDFFGIVLPDPKIYEAS